MKKVKTVNVKGKKYKIYMVDKFSEQFGSNCDGLCKPDERKIYIDAKLDEDRKRHVLLHELLHALFNEISVYQVISRSVEELLVDNIAEFMNDLFFVEGSQFNHK